jgi:hypothetical protein
MMLHRTCTLANICLFSRGWSRPAPFVHVHSSFRVMILRGTPVPHIAVTHWTCPSTRPSDRASSIPPARFPTPSPKDPLLRVRPCRTSFSRLSTQVRYGTLLRMSHAPHCPRFRIQHWRSCTIRSQLSCPPTKTEKNSDLPSCHTPSHVCSSPPVAPSVAPALALLSQRLEEARLGPPSVLIATVPLSVETATEDETRLLGCTMHSTILKGQHTICIIVFMALTGAKEVVLGH